MSKKIFKRGRKKSEKQIKILPKLGTKKDIIKSKKQIILNAPVKNFYITSPYGKLRKLDYRKQKKHTGIDFVGYNGKHYLIDDVLASVNGTVIFAKDEKFDTQKRKWGGRGSCVTIQCELDKTVFICFYHLSKIYVKEGQFVGPKDKIGKIGNSGHSFGAHLHYEVKVAKSNSFAISRGLPYPASHVDPDFFYVGDFNAESGHLNTKIYNILTLGKSGADVEFLQERLIEMGYKLLVDGVFGEVTEEIIKEIQEENELKVDGIVGSQTWRLILK